MGRNYYFSDGKKQFVQIIKILFIGLEGNYYSLKEEMKNQFYEK